MEAGNKGLKKKGPFFFFTNCTFLMTIIMQVWQSNVMDIKSYLLIQPVSNANKLSLSI
jgi:hypothetical protein